MLTNSSRILNLIKPLPIFFVTKDVYYLKPWFQISAIIVAIFSFIFSAYQIHQGQYRYNQSLILESYSILSDKDSLSAAKTFAMNTIVKNNGSIDGANIGHWESINTASKVELKNTSKTRLRRMDFSHQEILWSCKDCEIKDSIGVNFTLDNHVGTKQSSSYSLLNSIFSDNEIRNSELKKIIKTYIINGFIEKVNFTDNIRNSAFIFSSIIDSKIEDLTLENNSFEGSTIRNVSFKGTSLNNVSLVGTKFESVDFTGSSWKDVNITNAEFINVKGLTCENSKGAIGTDNITGKTWCSNIITKDRASLNTKTVSIKEYLSERLNMAEKFEFENTILNINKNSVSEDFGTISSVKINDNTAIAIKNIIKLLRNKDLTIENIPLTLISAVEQSNYKYDRNGKIVSLSLFSSKKTSINERHKKYLPLTEKYSKEYGVASALLLAIIRVESAFNPLAKSHIPAYGLMQIRPIFYNEVNGSSISNHVEELYKPDTNIRVGAAYLSKLKYLYLEDIEDLNKKQLTMIASYHGGFNSIMKSMNENSLKSTTKKINEISFEEYYHTLVENLPYDETINYIEKVWDRFEYYQEQLKVSTSLDIER